MEYVQERIATLHDLAGRVPEVSGESTCAVVPMTERDHATLAAERTLSELEAFGPDRAVIALRSPPDRVAGMRRWLADFDLPLEVVWCTGEPMLDLLGEHGLNGPAGKGRDLWLALGVATTDHDRVVVHDADSRTVARGDFARLLAPLAREFSFVKGYYARVENRRLYGRLCRLLYTPLVWALREERDAPILEYLDSFRYALAGEFAASADVVRELRAERRFGFEIGTLGEAFDRAGFEGTAQVDLGRYEHDHRAVRGPTGLSDMSEDVAAALLRVVGERGVEPNYETLTERFYETAERLLRQYAADAAFNGFEYDQEDEREQVEAYAEAIEPTTEDDRLPAWNDTDLAATDVLAASRRALANAA